jgi:hypothetical protein
MMRRVQIGVDAAIALRRDPIKLAGSEPPGFREVALLMGALFIVVLIHAFQRASIDQKRLESAFRTRHGCQDSDSQVNRSNE